MPTDFNGLVQRFTESTLLDRLPGVESALNTILHGSPPRERVQTWISSFWTTSRANSRHARISSCVRSGK